MQKIKLNLLVCVSVFFYISASSAWASGPSAEIGKDLYSQPGTNSCLYCHGVGGEGGKIAAAAKLTHPKQWKSFKGIGGEAAYKANKTQFVGRLKEAVIHSITNGAILHNMKFKPAWYDAKKAGGNLNVQMLGLKSAPSMAWLNKQKASGMTPEIAAESAWLYIQTFDTEGVFK